MKSGPQIRGKKLVLRKTNETDRELLLHTSKSNTGYFCHGNRWCRMGTPKLILQWEKNFRRLIIQITKIVKFIQSFPFKKESSLIQPKENF